VSAVVAVPLIWQVGWPIGCAGFALGLLRKINREVHP
jgi:hypothetical protein